MPRTPKPRLTKHWTGLVAAVGLGAALLAPAPPAAASAPEPETLVSPAPLPTPGFDGPVLATASAGGTVYIGGEFSHAIIGRQRIPRSGLAAVDAGTGALLGWAPAADGPVTALATHAGDVFVAGRFGQINGVPRDSLTRLDGATGAIRPGWSHVIYGAPHALATGPGRLYVAGSMSRVGAYQRSGLAALDLATGAVLPWAPAADALVEALVVTADRVYLGGRFRRINDVRGSQRIAAVHPVTGALDTGFHAADATERAYDLAMGPEGLYAAHGGLGGRVRAYDHSGQTRWELTMDGDPVSVATLGSVVYFGGHFDEVCRSARVVSQGACVDGSLPRSKLGAASGQDGSLLPWRADGNGVVGVRVLGGDQGRAELAVGGEFTTINGQDRRRFALFRAPTVP